MNPEGSLSSSWPGDCLAKIAGTGHFQDPLESPFFEGTGKYTGTVESAATPTSSKSILWCDFSVGLLQ